MISVNKVKLNDRAIHRVLESSESGGIGPKRWCLTGIIFKQSWNQLQRAASGRMLEKGTECARGAPAISRISPTGNKGDGKGKEGRAQTNAG